MGDPVWTRAHRAFQALFDAPDEDREAALGELRDRDPDTETAVRALLRGHEIAEGPFDRLHTTLGAGSRDDEDDARLVAADPATRWVRIRELGRGGAGVVHLADDTTLGRRVAIKTLARDLASSTAARRRLLAEARTVANLDHPNIVPLHEVGVDADGCVFLVLGYAPGETLTDRLRREGRLDLDTALPVALAIARALAAAHAQDVVHRDVKPANVLVGEGGAVRLTDFGIAGRPMRAEGRGRPRFGTPAYMAPEALDGAEADPRSDIWALGIVLHEMLTGRHPPRADGGVTIELEGEKGDPRWTAVEGLLRRMLAVDPTARPPDGAAVVEELEGLVGDAAAGGRRGRWGIALGGLAVGAAGLAALALLRDPAPPPLPLADPGSRGHVLWVDDDPRLSGAEEGVLERGGFRVSRARSTAEALAAYDPALHQVVVSDLGRLEEGEYRAEAGLELIEELRVRDPAVRVVFFTSDRALEVIRAAPAGAGAFGATGSSTEFYRLVVEAVESGRGAR